MRTLAAIAKIVVYLFASLGLVLIQGTILFFTKGPISFIYPPIYHRQCCRIFGVKILTEGAIEREGQRVYLGNHLSYMDIPVMGSLLKGAFVAKKDILNWPFFGALGTLGQTVYISRAPQDAQRETAIMLEKMQQFPLIIFPEGTSTNGTSVLPFKSSFFEIFLNKNIKIQPFTITIAEINKQPVFDSNRDAYAWYGDMSLEPHLWAFAKSKGCVVKVTFQKPLLSHEFTDRKALCAAAYEGVVKGLDFQPTAA